MAGKLFGMFRPDDVEVEDVAKGDVYHDAALDEDDVENRGDAQAVPKKEIEAEAVPEKKAPTAPAEGGTK